MTGEGLAYLAATVLAYGAGRFVYDRSGGRAWVNPVLIAVALLGAGLVALDVPYQTYFDGARPLHVLLGPATALLAVPLYKHIHLVRQAALVLGVTLIVGSVFSALVAVGLAALLAGSEPVLQALAVKSATTPIALGIAQTFDGPLALTAVVVIGTGILCAMTGERLFAWTGIADPRAQGFALGVIGHGIGTGRAIQIGPVAAAFSGLGMGLNGVFTALWAPWAVPHLVAILGSVAGR